MVSTLPIVARELRVRSRQASTAWMRALVAGIALLFVVGLLLSADSGMGRSQVGRAVFHSLTWVMFIFVLVFGVWLTHDNLSGERREGTLGLLFLTDLRALDVVLGKLSAAGLTAVFAVLATVPPLAVTLMVGGVTGGEVLRFGLVLLNALFGGMGLGLWVSSRQEDESRALTQSLGWLAAWVFLPLVPDLVLAGGSYAPEHAAFSTLSPLVMHVLADDSAFSLGEPQFWISLAMVHFLGWCFLGMAAGRARTCWQEKAATTAVGPGQRRRTSRPFTTDEDPLRWLVTRHLNARRRAWWAALLMSLPALTPFLFIVWSPSGTGPGLLGAISYSGFLFHLIGMVMLASLVCRPIIEGRQSGLLETLQTTPLRAAALVEACWQGLRRIVLPPILLFAILEAGIQILLSRPWYGSNITFSFGGWIGVGLSLAGNIVFVWALVWTGMWEAASVRRPGRAVPLTLLWVLVLPVIAGMLPLLFLFRIFSVSASLYAWSHNLIPLAVMVGVWRASEKRMRTRFRRAITQDPLSRREEAPPVSSFGDWMRKGRSWQAD